MASDSARERSLSGHVFDSYQNMMQIARCVGELKAMRGARGVSVLEASRRDTGLSAYLSDGCAVTRFATHADDKLTLSGPVQLPYPDKSFDCCIVTDAFEHIPADMRQSLVREMIRVTHGLVLLGCPHDDEIVTRFDRVVFDFIWGKYAERFEPLEQHNEFGLTSRNEIEKQLRAEGATEVVTLPCNYVYRWIHMILIYFDLQHDNPHWDLFSAINNVYNKYLSNYDYQEPCYRYLMMVATDPALDAGELSVRLRTPAPIPASVLEIEGNIREVFQEVDSRISDRLLVYTRENERLRKALSDAAAEQTRLSEAVQRLHGDNSWATDEIVSLQELVCRLQDDNAWARNEIERLRATPDKNLELGPKLRMINDPNKREGG